MNGTTRTKPGAAAKDLAFSAAGAAVIAVCAWISLPLTVPVTMQTLAVFFVLSVLGGRRGTVSVLLYILLGAVGVPVFAGFTAGLGVLLGSTGGYIVGFLFTGLIYWLFERVFGENRIAESAALVLGLFVCYAFGTVWFRFVYNRSAGEASLGTVLSWCVLPFIVPDLLKLAAARALAFRLAPALKKL